MLPLEELTVGALLQRTCAKFGSRPAVWYQGEFWTWERLERQTRQYETVFAAQGIHKGDHVGIWAEAEPKMLAAYYALQSIGAVTVMLNTSLTCEELQERIRIADVEYLCIGRSYKSKMSLATVCSGDAVFSGLKKVFAVGESRTAEFPSLDEMSREEAEPWMDTVRRMEAAVQPQDTAAILFTSGSTSFPKAVMSSHYSRVNNGIQQAFDLHADEQDIFCVAMPMFHCFCISVNAMACLATGACLCLPKDRHTASILDAIEQVGCTVLNSVPTMYLTLIANPAFASRRVATLRIGIIGGAMYRPEQFVAIEKALGMTLMSSLGQTECSAGLTVCNMDESLERRSHTVGHFMNYVEGKIADPETGAALPAGKCGEICVRGYLVMQGYYGQPELTAKTLDAEGWLHTGDLGMLDENGDITLHGRIKDLVIRGGENISPAEVEQTLGELPEIRECKVVGVPDEHYGEELCACICLKSGSSLPAERVRAQLAKRLAYYKIPRYLLYWGELPHTDTGKVDKRAVEQRARVELGMAQKNC